ncbi:hypothetical protein [Komagataeibacter melomenusus]|uniref:hypothetical protein n=1 Tax=Komagataeibacter melomenusus TaxID=2766578 RepID=UPI001F50B9AB|nr:hypothetical protein [Komagataeibacter melomenusus]
MDRQIVYPAQIPLDSDLLNAQRNAFVGLGHLAGMAYGDNTVAAGGFACTPGTGLAVTIAPGSLLAAGVVDGTAYGTLAANGSVLARQYVSRDPVTLTVPGAGATYTVYATPATVDADATVLPFYNAADPAVTYAGADNSGKAAPTVRQDLAQLGIAATVPDGAYPLWSITVPAAATSITADIIAQATGAPFYLTIPELQGQFVKSVPSTGQTRIEELVENADGRAVFGDRNTDTVLANLADLPFSDTTQKIQAFTVSGSSRTITFPVAFKPGTIPVVVVTGNMAYDATWDAYAVSYCFNNLSSDPYTPAITNESIVIDATYLTSRINPPIGQSNDTSVIHVVAIGEI